MLKDKLVDMVKALKDQEGLTLDEFIKTSGVSSSTAKKTLYENGSHVSVAKLEEIVTKLGYELELSVSVKVSWDQ